MNSKSLFKVIKKEVRVGASLNLEAYRRLISKPRGKFRYFGFALSVAWTSLIPAGAAKYGEDGLCVVDMGRGYGLWIWGMNGLSLSLANRIFLPTVNQEPFAARLHI